MRWWIRSATFIPMDSQAAGLRIRSLAAIKMKRVRVWSED